MISKLSDKCCKKEEKPFPKLMIGEISGNVYLMKDNNAGTVVHEGDHGGDMLGDYLGMIGDSKHDYEGDVCLTND